jgi:hypothetical protein
MQRLKPLRLLQDYKMTKVILPKKNSEEHPVAINDVAEEQLIKDPTIPQFGPPILQNQILTQPAETTAANNAVVLVENTNHDWINNKWRPAMGWMYMVVCITDFIVFPILWSIIQALVNGKVEAQYQPLTLLGAGLFHISMGAVLGLAVYGRTKEKIEGINK